MTQLKLLNDRELIKINGQHVATGSVIAVWFSNGAASAVAAKKTIELYGDRCTVRVVNNPVIEEHPDNQRFLKDVERWIDQEIEIAFNPKYPNCSAVEVWDKKQAMSFPGGAPCTSELKKQARLHWEQSNQSDYLVMGFTVDELDRSNSFQVLERSNLLSVLIDLRLSKQDCIDLIVDAGIIPPELYRLGFPNNNCIGCCKATSPTYWNLVRKHFPDIFQQRAEQSRRLGVKLVRVKGDRISLDELDPSAIGDPLESLHIECGIFCEEKP